MCISDTENPSADCGSKGEKQIEKAQMKVEGHNFEIRKHLLDYDNVMNEQRRVIYRLRREILDDKDNLGFVHEMLEDVCEGLVESYRPEKKVGIDAWPWSDIAVGFQNIFHTETSILPRFYHSTSTAKLPTCLVRHTSFLSPSSNDIGK